MIISLLHAHVLRATAPLGTAALGPLGHADVHALQLLALLPIERRGPDHHIIIRGTRDHLVPQRTEISGSSRTLVSLQSVHDLPPEQVPDLERAVIRRAEQLVAARVHGNGVDHVLVCLLVLDEPVGAQVEHLDLVVRAAGGDAGAVRVEFDSVHG